MPDEKSKPAIGSIGWFDLTVPDAVRVRDFYAAVVGWKSQGFDMGGYEDFVMAEPESGRAVAGVCNKRGVNADVPSQWLLYIIVANCEAAAQKVVELGGELVRKPGSAGAMGRYCVIRDPAGAVCALFEPT
jgi:predicted enzyme related to lactoylglutathione lyase